MRPVTLIALMLPACALVVGTIVSATHQDKTEKPLRLVVGLIAEQCEWEHETWTLRRKLECVRDKIDESLKKKD